MGGIFSRNRRDQLYSRNPTFLEKVQIWLSKRIPIDSWLLPGLITLVFRRNVLNGLNLIKAPDAPESGPSIPALPYRRPDASGTDANDLHAGASGTPFARNMTPNPNPNPLRDPPVQLVAQKLLARQQFQPAGDQLNVLAAAWIQFMAHDWMRGAQTTEDVVLKNGKGCPLHSFKFQKTAISDKGTTINDRTHWWDTSVVYGSDREALDKIREFKGGRLLLGKERGVLPRNADDTLNVGDNRNSWIGVLLLQELFIREHNAACAFIAREHPHLANDDEALFNLGRLCVTAICAKIHTVDWTPTLLDMEILDYGMNTNWYGILRALKIPGFKNKNPPGPLGLVGHKSNNKGIPFSLTEEFVAVYRLHPLLPDGLPLESGYKELSNLVGPPGEQHLTTEKAALETWDALIKYPCGHLLLFNYPVGLRDLTTTDLYGKPIDDPVDLAALDLYRDRERGIRNYNDFRRAMHLKPFKSYEEMTGKPSDSKEVKTLTEVYGADGIENVDLLVGNLAEAKIRGFALSETQFNLFLLMASRRLEADRFLNEDFNEKVYTRAGMAWVRGRRNMRDVLEDHFPEMRIHFPKELHKGKQHSAFRPTDKWPAQYLEPQSTTVEKVVTAEPISS